MGLFINLMATNLVLFSEKLDSITNIEKDMTILNDEEIEVLEELFQLEENILELEKESSLLSGDIEELNKDLEIIQSDISKLDAKYTYNLSIMESFLQNYQKKGPLDKLQLILSSENLNVMLLRLNSIRELSKGVSSLLEDLEKDREILARQKLSKDQTLFSIKERQAKVLSLKKDKENLANTLEAKLLSLKEDRIKYENYLSNINKSWKDTKPKFTDAVLSISNIVESGDLPQDLVHLRYSLTGISAKIYDSEFNAALNKKNLATLVKIDFNKDHMTLSLPQLNIFLSGSLEIIDDTSLQFNISEGRYLDLNLGKASIESLFDSNYLKFNFKKILMGHSIKSLNKNGGNIELLLNISF